MLKKLNSIDELEPEVDYVFRTATGELILACRIEGSQMLWERNMKTWEIEMLCHYFELPKGI